MVFTVMPFVGKEFNAIVPPEWEKPDWGVAKRSVPLTPVLCVERATRKKSSPLFVVLLSEGMERFIPPVSSVSVVPYQKGRSKPDAVVMTPRSAEEENPVPPVVTRYGVTIFPDI